jgi:hypothetical protein
MKTKKIIIGAVVVLGAYYLYNKYKVKSEVADLKEGADYPAPYIPFPVTTTPDKVILQTIVPVPAKVQTPTNNGNTVTTAQDFG